MLNTWRCGVGTSDNRNESPLIAHGHFLENEACSKFENWAYYLLSENHHEKDSSYCVKVWAVFIQERIMGSQSKKSQRHPSSATHFTGITTHAYLLYCDWKTPKWSGFNLLVLALYVSSHFALIVVAENILRSGRSSLLNPMVFMNGGGEHSQLRHNPCQIELCEGGLKGRMQVKTKSSGSAV